MSNQLDDVAAIGAKVYHLNCTSNYYAIGITCLNKRGSISNSVLNKESEYVQGV